MGNMYLHFLNLLNAILGIHAVTTVPCSFETNTYSVILAFHYKLLYIFLKESSI